MLRWFEQDGEDGDVVISSRIRLARNLSDYNFSLKLQNKDAEIMTKEVMEKLKNLKKFKDYNNYNLSELSEFQKTAMKERHAISPFLLKQKTASGLISPDENISIMLNEEDHIRIQSFVAGKNMSEAFKEANIIDDCIGNVLEYAYNSQYGYLTTCPSNVGTGLRASYMLHLPVLSSSKLTGIASEIGRFGLTIRGMYGEGTNTIGDIYQISNQVTLGYTEEEIIDNLDNIVEQIIQQERAARKQYFSSKKVTVEDAVYRSYGVLKYARKLSLKDGMILLSEIKLGLSQGIIKPANEYPFSIYQLMVGMQPANLQLLTESELTQEELSIERAKFIRENLPLVQ